MKFVGTHIHTEALLHAGGALDRRRPERRTVRTSSLIGQRVV